MSKWMHEPDKGLLVECHTHAVDLIRWFVGEVESVYVSGNAFISNWAKKYGTLDNATMLLKLKNGTIADLFGTATSGHPEKTPYGNVIINIYGTNGTISANLEKQPLTVFLKESYSKDLIEGFNYPDTVYGLGRLELAKHFIDCILNDKTPLITGEDATKVLEILLAGKKSVKTQKEVKLSEK
jgi:myo-inositol 2-dehydrogenase/D-chiro-inositol 1-dehydrogenase